MKHLLNKLDAEYIGGDIVLALIESHKREYKSNKVSFVHINLIKEKIPSADLMIRRDFLIHMSFMDTRSFLENYIESNIK